MKQIPWATGGGNLILLFEGEGDGLLYAASDTENRSGATRSLSVNLRTTLGANVANAVLRVSQKSIRAYVEGERLVFTSASSATVAGEKLTLQAADGTVQGETLKLNK